MKRGRFIASSNDMIRPMSSEFSDGDIAIGRVLSLTLSATDLRGAVRDAELFPRLHGL